MHCRTSGPVYGYCYVVFTYSNAGLIGARDYCLPRMPIFGNTMFCRECEISKFGTSSKDIGALHRLIYCSLLASTDYNGAVKILADERVDLLAIAQLGGASSQAASKSGVTYVSYLSETWMPESLWQSWSQKGRSVASSILKIPIEGVLPTTNHLESFNSVLKQKHIPRWQRSGSRLRFDFLIQILINNILPDIFVTRISIKAYQAWLTEQFEKLAGGVDLVDSKTRNSKQGVVCWWESDPTREHKAMLLVRHGQLFSIQQTINQDRYEAYCLSSNHSANSLRYHIHLHRSRFGSCTCLDFLNRGGACKHLCAFRHIIDSWARNGHILPFFYPPTQAIGRHLANVDSHPLVLDTNHAKPQTTIKPSVLTNILALQQVSVSSKNNSDSEGEDCDSKESALSSEDAMVGLNSN